MISTPSPQGRLPIWALPDIESLELMFLLEHGYDPDHITDPDLIERNRNLLNQKRSEMDAGRINVTRRLRGRRQLLISRTKNIFVEFEGQDIASLEGEFDNVRNMLHEEMTNGTAESLNDIIESERFADFASRHGQSLAEPPLRVLPETFDDSLVFATIGLVKPSSPAQIGGIRPNDKLIKFGYIDIQNFTEVEQLARLTRESINRPIILIILRGSQAFRASVTPRRSKLPELVGCQVIKSVRIGL